MGIWCTRSCQLKQNQRHRALWFLLSRRHRARISSKSGNTARRPRLHIAESADKRQNPIKWLKYRGHMYTEPSERRAGVCYPPWTGKASIFRGGGWEGDENARAYNGSTAFAHEFPETLIIYRGYRSKVTRAMKRRVRDCERDTTTHELLLLTSYHHIRERTETSWQS